MKKRIWSIVLAVVISLQVVAVAASSDNQIDPFFDAMGFDTSMLTGDTVTRGEFAQLVMMLYRVDDTSGLFEKSAFADVSVDHAAFDAIHYLRQMGIVNGAGSGLFLAENSITISEACTMLVKIMGYDYKVKDNNYLVVAGEKKLLEGVRYNADGTFDAAAAKRLMYNTLHASVADSNTYNGFSEEILATSEPYMTKRLGIYHIAGVVTDDGLTSVTGLSDAGFGKLIINGMLFNNHTGADDLLGYAVSAYYEIDRETYEKNLLYIYARERRNNVLTIDARDMETYVDHKYIYYDGDAERIIRISSDFNLIYNGAAYASSTVLTPEEFSQIMVPELGYVKLLDSNNDGTYETVIVKNYKNVVVDAVDNRNMIITDKLSQPAVSYDLSKAKSLYIRSTSGTETSLASIMSGNVVSISMSLDGRIAEVILSTDVVSGVITSMDDEKYYIGEQSYTPTKSFKRYLEYRIANGQSVPKAGDEVTFCLNHISEIAYYKGAIDDNMHFAYLVKTGKIGAGLDVKFGLQLVLDTKEVKDSVLAKKVRIDGKMTTSDDTLLQNLNGFCKKLIVVGYNMAGEINVIDTPYSDDVTNPNAATETDDSLHIVSALGERKMANEDSKNTVRVWYAYEAASFEGKISVDSNTVAFVVPQDTNDPKQILVTDFTTNYRDSNWRYPTAYRMYADSMVADAVIMEERSSGISIYNNNETEDCAPYVVKKVFNALNENGEEVTGLVVTQGGIEETYYGTTNDITAYTHTDGNMYTISEGDVIQFGYNKDKQLEKDNIRIFYDCETDSSLLTYANTSLSSNSLRVNSRDVEVQSGWANRKTSSHFELALKDPASNVLMATDKLIFTTAATTVLVYDRARNILSSGSMADILPYESGFSNYSRVVVSNRRGMVHFMVVYR